MRNFIITCAFLVCSLELEVEKFGSLQDVLKGLYLSLAIRLHLFIVITLYFYDEFKYSVFWKDECVWKSTVGILQQKISETHSFVTDITVSDSEVEHVNNINM